MNERSERLKVILRILKDNRVESQEMLLNLLENHGISITQATLSRDLKVLKVSKVGAGVEGYYYCVPSEDERKERQEVYVQDFLRGYVSIDWNISLVVIRTFSGHAGTVALAIDSLGLDTILGTVSGRDNTVFAALKAGSKGEDFLEELRTFIPGLEHE